MSPMRTGDRVKVAAREVTPADVKSGLFYEYFCNLTGVVERAYDDGTASIKVDLESLPVDIQRRHREVEESVKRRWMSSLGEESRERLSEKEKNVALSYNILVSAKDLERLEKGKAAPRPRTEPKAAATAGPAKRQQARGSAAVKETRPSETDIKKAEEEYLKSIAAKQKRKG